MRKPDEHSVCSVALGVCGDLARAVHKDIDIYCNDIMILSLDILKSQSVPRSVKPHAISLFADIALAIEGGFERFCPAVLAMLGQAGRVLINETDDEDHVEYINSLREAILEAYTGMVQVCSFSNFVIFF